MSATHAVREGRPRSAPRARLGRTAEANRARLGRTAEANRAGLGRTGQRRPVRSSARRRSRRLIKRGAGTTFAPVAILSSICVAAAVCAVLLEQVVLVQSAFKLSRLSERVEVAHERHQELLLEASRLASPGRIERFARDRLGMVEAKGHQYVVADLDEGPQRYLPWDSRRSRGVRLGPAVAGAAAIADDNP